MTKPKLNPVNLFICISFIGLLLPIELGLYSFTRQEKLSAHFNANILVVVSRSFTGENILKILLKAFIPSSSAWDGPALPLDGVFMNNGKMVLSPRISMNFWQLSTPSGPVMAWFSTLIALFLDIFFSLKLTNEKKCNSNSKFKVN